MRLRQPILSLLVVAVAAEAASAQLVQRDLTDYEIRSYAQLLAMTDTRQFDSPLLERLLESDSRPLRVAALRGL